MTAWPGFKFPYYDPKVRVPGADEPGSFEHRNLEPLPLPDRSAPPPAAPRPLDVPDWARHVTPPAGAPQSGRGGVAWAAPPLAGVLLVLTWRRLFPDAARIARRRSRAARRALAALARADGDPGRVAGIVYDYLRDRHGLADTSRTPLDADESLATADVMGRALVVGVLERLDAARFGGEPFAGAAARAADAIATLEGSS